MNRPIEITIYTRKSCCLCEEAKAALSKFKIQFPLNIQEVDVDRDEGLADEYGETVPVVFIEGKKHFKYRVDPRRLEILLTFYQARA